MESLRTFQFLKFSKLIPEAAKVDQNLVEMNEDKFFYLVSSDYTIHTCHKHKFIGMKINRYHKFNLFFMQYFLCKLIQCFDFCLCVFFSSQCFLRIFILQPECRWSERLRDWSPNKEEDNHRVLKVDLLRGRHNHPLFSGRCLWFPSTGTHVWAGGFGLSRLQNIFGESQSQGMGLVLLSQVVADVQHFDEKGNTSGNCSAFEGSVGEKAGQVRYTII